MPDSREIGEVKLRRERAHWQAAGLPSLRTGSGRELSFDCLQSQQEAAILADELKPEPGSHADQHPGQNSSEHEGSHQKSPMLVCETVSGHRDRRRPSAGAMMRR